MLPIISKTPEGQDISLRLKKLISKNKKKLSSEEKKPAKNKEWMNKKLCVSPIAYNGHNNALFELADALKDIKKDGVSVVGMQELIMKAFSVALGSIGFWKECPNTTTVLEIVEDDVKSILSSVISMSEKISDNSVVAACSSQCGYFDDLLANKMKKR